MSDAEDDAVSGPADAVTGAQGDGGGRGAAGGDAPRGGDVGRGAAGGGAAGGGAAGGGGAGTPAGRAGGTPAIEAIDVRKTFDRGIVRALDGLTLAVAPGEYAAITGPSGCGKSTLLHLLAALDRPDGGTLRVQGIDLNALQDPDGYRRQEIGLVFQLHNLLPHLSALQNVEIAMFGTRRTYREQRDRAMELLEAVDLQGMEHRRPPQLSGGERQRVALARALANDPHVLLADEPTGNLDSASVQRVLELLEHLRDTRPVTVLMVTHDPIVAATADRTVYMRDGRVTGEERRTPVPTPEG